MKNLEKLNKETVNNIAKEMNAFAITVAEKYGVKFKPKGGSFTSESFSPSIRFEIIAGQTSNGDNVSVAEINILKIYGFELGQKVKMNNKSFEIVGAKPRATKNNIIIRDVYTKKDFVTNGDFIKVN